MSTIDLYSISIDEFKKYANNPDWCIKSWLGTLIGPGDYEQYADSLGFINCVINKKYQTILVY